MAEIKENVIEWITGSNIIAVTLSQGKYINKVKRLAEKYPEKVAILAENSDGSIFAHLPLKALNLSIKATAELSEERKAELKERLSNARANKKL